MLGLFGANYTWYFFLTWLPYYFEKERLRGMTRQEVEQVFGPLILSDHGSLYISAGRDSLYFEFQGNRVSSAVYVMGF